MSALRVLAKLGPVDLKNVRRDPLLLWLPIVPVLVALLLRWGIPPLAELVRLRAGRDLVPWYPLLMSSFVVMLPGIVGTVIGFLLLDERDDGVLEALLVTPIGGTAYLGYRIAVPLAAGFLMTLLTYPVAGLTPLPFIDLAAAASLGSFGAPLMALLLASFAENKVTGFAVMKLINAVQVLPLVAWFVAPPAQLLFGIVPTYWPMKIVWLAAEGRPWGGFFVAGLVVNGAAVGLLMRRFDRILHR